MLKRLLIGTVVFIVLYVGLVQVQMIVSTRRVGVPQEGAASDEGPKHKVYFFSFAKYSPDGEKEIEIEGDSADILARTVDLMNVVAKAYAEESPVTITADQGNYDKANNKVHLENNVVATTENGTRLLTEELDIHPTQRLMETGVEARVKRDNINVQGLGASGDSQMKKVRFNKNVTVVVKETGEESPSDGGPTVITCDGPLVVDYAKNIAHFTDNVVAADTRGKLTADAMDVYYNKVTRKVSKIVALGNVVIENPDGNQTFSDSVIYLADEGRIILGGDAEALYYEGKADVLSEGIF